MKFQVHLTCVFCPTFTTIYIYSDGLVAAGADWLVVGSESGVILVTTVGSSPTLSQSVQSVENDSESVKMDLDMVDYDDVLVVVVYQF